MTIEFRCDYLQNFFFEMHKNVFIRLKEDIDTSLGYSHMHMLKYLAYFDQSTVTDIANHLGVTLSAVTGLVNKLHALGYVNRQRDESDRRLVYIQITEEGRKIVEILDKNSRRVFEEYFSNLTSEEVNTLFSVMEKVFDKIAKDMKGKKSSEKNEGGVEIEE